MVKREDTTSCWKSSKPAPVDKSALVRHFDEVFRFSIGMIQSIWEALSMCAHQRAHPSYCSSIVKGLQLPSTSVIRGMAVFFSRQMVCFSLEYEKKKARL